MNKQANILFIPSSCGNSELQDTLKQHSSYQQFINALLARSVYTIEGFRSLSRHLAIIARQAYWAKQMDAVEQATQIMLALPISDPLEDTARYYQALCLKQRGDFDGARRLLERIAEEATPQYRARAFQVIGATYFERGEVDSSVQFYLAAGKAAVGCDPLTLAASQKMTAVVRSIHGDHKQALADFENVFPLVRSVGKYYPVLYYDFLNGLAVELGEVGRVAEAEAACAIALASPFAAAYPEWTATRDEIAAKRQYATPSVVTINRAPEAEPAQQVEPERKRLPVSASRPYGPGLKKDSVQRSIIPIAASEAFLCPRIIQSILDWMRKRIGPRAPPTFS